MLSELEKGTSGIPLATRGDAQQVKVPWAYRYRGNVGTAPRFNAEASRMCDKGNRRLRPSGDRYDCRLCAPYRITDFF